LFYEKIITANAPAPIGPYNQAVLKGDIYTSGQIAIDPIWRAGYGSIK
jgi:2-iminobutanoate/2-iminopropanoate deaminase